MGQTILMPFRRKGLGNQIHSIKHVLDTEGALSGAVKQTVPIGTAVITRSDPFSPVEIELGETVNAIFVSLFTLGATGAGNTGSINWYIIKLRSNQTTTNTPFPGSTGTSPLRSQIFHEEKGLAGSIDGTPMAFKGVIVVPKHMRRMREGDEFQIVLRGTDATVDYNFCVKAIYKSFS